MGHVNNVVFVGHHFVQDVVGSVTMLGLQLFVPPGSCAPWRLKIFFNTFFLSFVVPQHSVGGTMLASKLVAGFGGSTPERKFWDCGLTLTGDVTP